MHDRWKRVEALFHAARALDPHCRSAFLIQECGGDDELVREVKEYLANEASYFCEDPDDSSAKPIPDARNLLGETVGSYEILRKVDQGGMGVVYEATQKGLDRSVALKIPLAPQGTQDDGARDRMIARVHREAAILARLDHPGVVPVHELGMDESGLIFFTMRFVPGQDLRCIIEKVSSGDHRWTIGRALRTIVRACETLAFAHSRGVIHRDLKPAHIVVGEFGEVYIIDWGLASLGTRSEAATAPVADSVPETFGPSSSLGLLTMEGDLIGTPRYMPPEQANGNLKEIDCRSDVYSVGAILYHLLSGRAPYDEPGGDGRAPLRCVQEGPPRTVTELCPEAPTKLVKICEKAMARDKADRYDSISALAEDLHAYLEGTVVQAFEQGAWAELKSYVRRHKLLVTLQGAIVVALIAGLLALYFLVQSEARSRQLELLRADLQLAGQSTVVGDLWPPYPRMIPAYEAWLAKTDSLLELLHERPASAAPAASGDVDREFWRKEQLDRKTREIERLEERIYLVSQARRYESERRDLERRGMPPGDLQDEFEALEALAKRTEAAIRVLKQPSKSMTQLSPLEASFENPRTGLIDGVSSKHGWGIRRRLEFARTIEQLTISGEEAVQRWSEAIESIASDPLYHGLTIRPQIGLLPLGTDPDSGLWEFAHLQTGVVPERDGATKKLVIGKENGLVMVLIPGGTFLMGAQGRDANGPNFDPVADPNEGPVFDVAVGAFFLSKYEMTQAQWERTAGVNPSYYQLGPTHPVETVSHDDCIRVLGWLGLSLPTEAQWEYAARAGSETPYSCGPSRECLVGMANLADRAAELAGATFPGIGEMPDFDDGFAAHAPVGSLRPNRFGLHNVHGNVTEWCLDPYGLYVFPVVGTDARRVLNKFANNNRVFRGGCFSHGASFARSSHRATTTRNSSESALGLRPSRSLDL